ncbi:DUF4270 domain-containing protein [Flavobacterium aquariorum]|uniref:DUF4270 domain-containing protein n=1 Tax=Flavobacterium aquariorum TaxID=2217670 RepID=A0A2W7UPT6_9FLAO|nr:DUF4270 domain-containing protein [Flavobacterium aquariorum]PZX95465.1 DUF4270 domain-containing protein [Flavobacterium aquariorum]
MLKNSFFKTIPFLLFIVLFNSCDKEFNVVGEDLIGDNSFDIQKSEYPVIAYNQKLGPIQSNNMDVNPLGVYDNPSFGTTNANFVTQVTLATLDPAFDASATIKKVVLTIPYFYDKTKTVVNPDGSNTYVLDSIYGPEKAKMKLSVYESGYFMRDLDPEEQFSQPQKYYNDQYSDFNQLKIGVPLNDGSNTAENTTFFFDPAEHVAKTTNSSGTEVTTRTPPGMELSLNKEFFLNKIIKAPAGPLIDNNAFKDYFRGLFFNIETVGGNPGNMAMLNFKSGKITITYSETINSVTTDKTLVLNLSGNTVSLLDQSNTNINYTNATNPTNINSDKGDANLYLKGGEGSMSIVKLFDPTDTHGLELTDGPNKVPDELDDMRRNKYLINEASLTFHLNSAAMGTSYVPQRIYLYDFKNNQVLIDYRESTVASNTKNNKYIFGGILTKKSDLEGGSYYKFRITNHIRNLVKYADSTNVDLGLVVTEDINKSSFYSLRDKTGFPLKAPMTSVMNPLGTIVFGNNIPTDDKDYNKRLKFEIYYTKPN